MNRDVYADLLSETRGMRRDQARARDRWYAALRLERKEAALFELEMLLKSFACFANPRNHCGPRRQTAIAAHDYGNELEVVRFGIEQATARIRELLGPRDRAYVFSRYLETVVPEDGRRHELLQQQLTQYAPEESLFVLRNAFASFGEMATGLLDLGRIQHRVFSALLNTITREIGRSEYFNPLVTLEFRPEFDRIRHASVLSAMHGASLPAHRLVAMTFLSLFRLLRYLQLVDQYAETPSSEPLALLILSVFRSDARALAHTLEERAGEALSDGFEQRLYQVPSVGLAVEKEALWHEVQGLQSLGSTLKSIGQSLRLETEVVCSRDLPAPVELGAEGALGPRLVVGTAALRAILHHALANVVHELDADLKLKDLGSAERLAVESSIRLRRDVWTFSQVLRAFLAKADSATAASDRWSSYNSFAFVREFLTHFRAIGYQLARRSDYPHFDRFLDGVGSLRDVDLLEVERMDEVVEECRRFMGYLNELFESICRRAELADHPFDRNKAIEHLRHYLGAA